MNRCIASRRCSGVNQVTVGRCFPYIGAASDNHPAREACFLRCRGYRVKGSYDDSVHCALGLADQSGWQLVADTSSPGHGQACQAVFSGYTVMAAETLDQIATDNFGS